MLVVIKGAGDIASGIAARLFRAGFRIIMTDLERPTSIRRTVCFSEAIRYGEFTVEDIKAVKADSSAKALEIAESGCIAVMADPDASVIGDVKPDAVVDAILAKKNLGTTICDAPVVIGIGPGFCAGRDCHAVIETLRGHYLGRAIYDGPAAENTNIPGYIGGFAGERVLRAPADGIFHTIREIGDMVKTGDAAGEVGGVPMLCTIDGALRGLLADGTPVHKGMKAGDVDPRGDASYCGFISDKALAVGGGALEAILKFTGALK